MFPTNIPVFIGIEQSEGNGTEPIGSFVTGTSEYMAALDLARERAAELNAEYPNEGKWYAYISDEHGHKKIL